MPSPVKLNFKMIQGSTFKEVLRWESDTKVYKPITSVSQSAPLVVQSANHGVPVGWRVKFTNIGGMKELNSADTYQVVTDVTTNSVTINSINSVGYSAYTSGGIMEYNQPVNLTGYTARMQLRSKLTSTDVLLELTTQNGGIVLDTTANTITLLVTAAQTSSLSFTSCVYSLEMVKGSEVTQLLVGNIAFDKEITR